MFLLTPPVARSQSDENVIDLRKEYNVKGAFLYSFGRYATWPEGVFTDDQQPFVIGVAGNSPIQAVLQQIQQSKKINSRAIVVRPIRTAQDEAGCHILFLASSLDVGTQRAVIQRNDQARVLLIGETPGFAQWGGVINFFVAEGSVRFEINIDAARRRELSVDAKLLRIASLVTDESPVNLDRSDAVP
jgi:hypothetical protein